MNHLDMIFNILNTNTGKKLAEGNIQVLYKFIEDQGYKLTRNKGEK